MVDANVKVSLDTRQAKAELRGLNKAAAGTLGGGIGKAGRGLRGIAGGLGIGGVGGAIGAGTVGALKGSLFGAAGDVMGAQFGPMISTITNQLFQGKNLTARANATAFENLPFQLMGMRETSNIPGVVDSFKNDRFIELQRLTGRALGELNPAFRSVTPDSPGIMRDLKTFVREMGLTNSKGSRETADQLIENLRKGR